MRKIFFRIFFIITIFPLLSYGSDFDEDIDFNKYHKLKTSKVYFKSIKGRAVIFGVGFYEDDRGAYFPGRMDNDKIFGSVTVFRLNKNNEPQLKKFLRGPWSIRSNSAPIKKMLFITSFAVLAEGDYVVVYDIYVLKSIPSDLNNIVMVSEKVTWK